MSDITLFQSGNVAIPDYLSDSIDETTNDLVGYSSIKRISIRNGAFHLVSGGKEILTSEENSLKVVVIRVAPFLRCRHLQHHRLRADLHRRDRDPIAGPEILDRLDPRIARRQQQRRTPSHFRRCSSRQNAARPSGRAPSRACCSRQCSR